MIGLTNEDASGLTSEREENDVACTEPSRADGAVPVWRRGGGRRPAGAGSASPVGRRETSDAVNPRGLQDDDGRESRTAEQAAGFITRSRTGEQWSVPGLVVEVDDGEAKPADGVADAIDGEARLLTAICRAAATAQPLARGRGKRLGGAGVGADPYSPRSSPPPRSYTQHEHGSETSVSRI